MGLTPQEEEELLLLLEADQKKKETDKMFQPQPGPQETFLNCTADIAIYGGAAGGGKTYALLLENLKHIDNSKFGSVIFRRTMSDITKQGAIWENALDLYPLKGAKPVENPQHIMRFPSSAKVSFSHLQYEKDLLTWQGGQIPLICCEVNTLIKMADGSKKRLSDIRIGDKVLTLSGIGVITAVSNRRLVDCVQCEDDFGNKQINSSTHKILTKQGWISYDDIVCAPRQHRDKEQSILCRFFRRFSLWFDKKLLFLKPYLERFYLRQRRILKSFQLQQDRQSLLEIFACKVQQDQGICCELSQYSNLKLLRHVLNHLPLKLHSQSLLSMEYLFHLAQYFGANVSVLLAKELLSLLDHCLLYRHQYDEPVDEEVDSSQGYVLQLNGVVQHIQKDLPWDDQGIAQKRIHHKLQYDHPYTFQEQIAEEDVFLSSIKITPCGKREVIDITVSTQCHYITEIGLINKNCFDELTHFTKKQFIYMMSRNRSTSGIKSYIRATCNPDADSWVADFISWWIDQETGFPIPERSGVVRYFIRIDDQEIWADTPEELVSRYQVKANIVKSATFILSSIYDNQIQLEKDPGYLANLNALGTVEKERLLHGNWKIKPSSGMYFKRDQVTIVQAIPGKLVKVVRAWDLAATIPTPQNPSPDATAGMLIGLLEDKRYIVLDLVHGRWQSADVRTKIHATAIADNVKYGKVTVRLPQDPGQAGKEQKESYAQFLSGFVLKIERMSGDKITRAEPFSSQWQLGNVLVLEGPWNDIMFAELEVFPEGKHDDIVDAGSDSFTELQDPYKLHIVSPLLIEKENYWAM